MKGFEEACSISTACERGAMFYGRGRKGYVLVRLLVGYRRF